MTRVITTLVVTVVVLSTVNAAFPPNISFSVAGSVSTGDGPSAVLVGDFNGDGTLDLAVVMGNYNGVGVYMGHGDGTFQLGPNSPRATDASLTISGTTGDFNGDGKLDVLATDIPGGLTGLWNSITGSVGGNVSVFLGDGAGNLAAHKDSGVGGDFPSAAAAGDFNGDGKLDVAVTNLSSHSVAILLGHGDGGFGQASQSPVSVGSRPTSVAVGDFNGDGKSDLAVTNAADNTLSILLAHGDGTFAAPSAVSVASRPIAVAVGDFNGDEKPDLAVASLLSSSVSILRGNGTGGFSSAARLGVGRNPSALAVGDFNKDGKQDLAVANRSSDMVSMLLGNGDGSFARFRNFSVAASNPLAIAAGDFNKDGLLDVTVANVASDRVSVLVNDTDLTPPALTMPAFATAYVYNSSLTLSFDATDARSGISSIVATLNGTAVSNGQIVTLTQPGTNTFTLTATDKVGNTATESATFAVLYTFNGFFPPMPQDGAGVFRLGSVIPLRFTLTDAKDVVVSTAVAKLTVQRLSGNTLVGTPIDAIAPGSADSGNLFRYYSGVNQYGYNLDTARLSKGTWQIQVSLDDGSVHVAVIGLK
jgi:hypothetical protein